RCKEEAARSGTRADPRLPIGPAIGDGENGDDAMLIIDLKRDHGLSRQRDAQARQNVVAYCPDMGHLLKLPHPGENLRDDAARTGIAGELAEPCPDGVDIVPDQPVRLDAVPQAASSPFRRAAARRSSHAI